MPRRPREQSPMGIYHVIMRGINRQNIFMDNEDLRKFIEKLEYFQGISEYRVFAYCLMDNHIHILIQEQRESLSTIVRRICSSYVLWYNKKYERIGHLFQDRYRSEVVDSEGYFLTVLRYIHQNPVTAKIVGSVPQYPWSSYSEYFKEGSFIDVNFVLEIFAKEKEKAIQYFVDFHGKLNEDDCLDVEEPKKSDERLKNIIKSQFGIEAYHISNEEENRKSIILKELKAMNGVSVRQIARLTGISRKIIMKV